MRVTKKVENYIREQVKAKIMPKYEAEKAESKRIISIKNDIENRACEAAKQAAAAEFFLCWRLDSFCSLLPICRKSGDGGCFL